MAFSYLLLGVGVLLNADLPTLVTVSFMLSLSVVIVGLMIELRQGTATVPLVWWLFSYSFLGLVPMIQVSSLGALPNGLVIDADQIIRANLVLTLWNVIFLATIGTRRRGEPRLSPFASPITRGGIRFLILTSYAVVLGLATTAGFGYFIGRVSVWDVFGNQPVATTVAIVAPTITVLAVIAAADRVVLSRSRSDVVILAIAVLPAILAANPFNQARFYIGAIAIIGIMRYTTRLRRPIPFSLMFSAALLTLFPFLNEFRREGLRTPAVRSLRDLATSQFGELHFDAFGNFLAAMAYVSEAGLRMGQQLLGSVLFFVPRAWWEAKPTSTSSLISNQSGLFAQTGFDNISAPLVAEVWIDFGLLGVIGGAWAIGLTIRKLELKAHSSSTAALSYLAFMGFTMFILRGSLISSFSFMVGFVIVVVGGMRLLSVDENWRAHRSPLLPDRSRGSDSHKVSK